MAPTRTHNSESSTAGSSKPKRHFKAKEAEQAPTAAPGVSKIKAALRQTRRLLAKDKLGADVRVETERRLKALETDLAVAEQSTKERTLATRYHKIKFFERQKVARKLTQVKKQLAETETETDKAQSKELLNLRVDLNYILHYPKDKKYISLFPPEVRNSDATEASSSKAEGKKATTAPPKLVSSKLAATAVDPTDAERDEIRGWIKERMEKGELKADPEMHLDERGNNLQEAGYTPQVASGKKVKSTKGASKTVEKEGGNKMVEKDAFFGDDGSDSD